jgi:hypothetical protein
MFEGQRLNYVVPGYTGYFYYNQATFPKKYTMSSNLLANRNPSPKFQDMRDMSPPSSPKIYMAIPSERPLSM